MTPLRVYHLDTGGCGACAVEVWSAVESFEELCWATELERADVVAFTGSLTPATQPAILALYREYIANRIPLVVVGRCALDGYPFGNGGVRAVPEIVPNGKVEACPPQPQIVLETLLAARLQRAGGSV